LREYGTHTVSRGVGLKVETLFEVGLGKDRTGAHVGLELKKGAFLGGAPMPRSGFLYEVEEWMGNF
jgi:hypothetical protein